MKKLTFILSLIFAIASLQAQNYLISFVGQGESTTVSSVKVDNLTKGTTLTMSGSDVLQLTGPLGINEWDTPSGNKLNIHPNPMNGACSFVFEAPEQGLAAIGLFDLTGKQIVFTQDQLTVGQHSYNLVGISSGIYILKITSATYSYSSKVISHYETGVKAQIEHVSGTLGIDKINQNQRDQENTGRKSSKTLYSMGYSSGDVVVAEGTSAIAFGVPGGYIVTTVVDPTETTTIVFDFFACIDKDGTSYPIVKIGTQFWMKENLKTTKYNDGSPIPLVTDNTNWSNLNSSAYCWYDNDSAKYAPVYGALYNWFTVNTGKLCPTGWHVPSEAEWTTLNTFLGGVSIAGGKLKETGTSHWESPNTGATNSTRFTALPGGYRDIFGKFNGKGVNGNWWLQTGVGSGSAKFCIIISSAAYAQNANIFNTTNGLSVRCIKN